jgi:hypothetical protein
LFLPRGWRIRGEQMEGVGHVHAQDEDDAHADTERSSAAMTRTSVPDGTAIMSIGMAVRSLQDEIHEARTLLLRRKQRRKQRT